MLRSLLLLVLLLCCVWSPLRAQYGMSRATLAAVPTAELPLQNNAALRTANAASRKPNRPEEFAVSLPVDLDPTTAGRWTKRAGRAVWQLRVHSAGAQSLNLGFTDYRLPEGAELYLATATTRYGPFTAADNADHAEFWSPLLPGDELLLELIMPGASTDGAALHLSTVNHDYLGIIHQLSGECNIDVACGAADGFPFIEDYRDAIRSVAAYTIDGRAKCTGFLVNNTNQDGRPLFLTAEHCRITAANAPSLVAYWNFENSSCREPGSVASGGQGDGSLKTFNSGARLLATYPGSDMTLLELTQPVNPAAGAYFAGWSAEDDLPTDGVATVHHPELDEKRISFSGQPTVAANATGITVSGPDFSYLKVVAWDEGTTQGGSSGAPLFDRGGRVRGQLFGGLAGCGNQQFDVFGYLNRSWTGGGTPETRLRDWLDPCGTDQRSSDGLDQSVLSGQVYADRSCLTRCVDEAATFTLRAGADFPTGSTITLIAPAELGMTTPPTSIRGRPFTVHYPGGSTAASGSYPIQVVLTAGSVTNTTILTLTLLDGVPAEVPRPLSPATNQRNVDPFLTFIWQSLPEPFTYDLQVATRADFRDRTLDLSDLTNPGYAPVEALTGSTTYYWRTRARSSCGVGDWSAPRSFTTAPLQCLSATSATLPLGIPERDSVQVIAEVTINEPLELTAIEVRLGIQHSFTGDLYADLVSPSGEVIRLFRPLLNGVCTGTDLYVDFSDDGETTAEAFANSCPSRPPGAYLSVRPLDPLASLLGTSAKGVWQLVLTDRAPQDGGEITDFDLRFCGKRQENPDLGVGLITPAIVACPTGGGSSQLQLGNDFTGELTLAVTAGTTPLDNYTFTFDATTGLLDVIFSAWTFAEPGPQPLVFSVFTAGGSERRATQTLTVLPEPVAAEPLSVELEASQATFRWEAGVKDATYTLQLSDDDDFVTPFYTESTRETILSAPRERLPPRFFYRLITTTACGTAEGPTQQVELDKINGVHDFGGDRSIALFPNPTPGQLTLTRQGNWSGEALRGVLYNASGQALREWQNLRSEQETLQLGDLPAGVYYLWLSSQTGAQTSRVVLY